MALVLKDRVKQTASNPGTGTVTLGTTPTGFQAFSAIGNGNTTYFAIVDPVSGDWEVNYGTYTSSGTTLSRNATPLSSSNGGALVNFTGTTLDVFCTYPSENAVWRDTAGTVVQQAFGAITATSAALTSGTITTAPSNATDIVNKEYADSISSGLNYHQPVNYASTAALPAYTYNNGSSGVGATITANANGALSLGGGSPTATQRVLVKDEVSGNAPYNGVYVVTQAGSAGTPFILTRATDYDTSGTGTNEIDQGDYVLVISGTLASTAWVQQTPLPITVGTTALTFLQFNAPITYSAGTGLNLSPATTFNISNTGVTASTYGSASAVPVFAVNAQGQITSVTNTNIAISGSAVSGNISGSAGSVANALTAGSYLTSAGTFDGSAARTFAVDATSANTASKVVARDASGNFSAGTITATLSGAATSATTATNIAGGGANQIPYNTAAGTTSFITAPTTASTYLGWNGSAFTYSAISTPNSVTFNNGGAGDASGTTFNGSAARTISYNTVGAPSVSGTNATGTWGISISGNAATATSATSATTATQVSNSLTAGTYLTGTAFNGSAAQTWTVDATSANTVSKVVARDASGNFSAGTITAALSGNATTATTATQVSNSLTLATSGTGLSGSATFNGSSAQTFTVSSNATSLNTASTIVARDASGNFTAGTITAALSGNASTATSATTAGSITGQANSATITATSANTANQIVLRDASGNFSAGTITASLNGNASTSSSTSGNAATATALSSGQSNWSGTGVLGNVVGMLAWKNYGNGHVIFDASASTSPSGGAVGNTNAAVAWSATYPTLMGWNGSSTYGVRVDSARISDSTSGSSASCTGNAATATTATNQSGGTVNATTIYGASYVNTAGPYYRNAAGSGYLNGQYASVESTTTSGAIYSIGGSYVPGSTNLGNMYGIGYGYSGNAGITATGAPGSLWGMYVASGGVSRIFLDSDNGRGFFNGAIYSAGNIVLNAGNYNSYSPTLTGTGASGTWSINVTGSAGSATTATTANALNTGNNYQVNSLGVGTAGSGTAGEIRATNAVTAYYSDDRLKTKLGNIEGALAKVKTLSGFYYEANETAQALGYKPKREVGVSAQSVQAVLPEVVVPAPIDEQYLTVHYDKLVPLLIEAIKELEAKVAALEAKG